MPPPEEGETTLSFMVTFINTGEGLLKHAGEPGPCMKIPPPLLLIFSLMLESMITGLENPKKCNPPPNGASLFVMLTSVSVGLE